VTVTPNTGGGPQTLSASHTYAEEGKYATGLMLSGVTAAPGTATVADAPLAGSGVAITVVQTPSAFSGTVARFHDADPAAALADYTATIDWGDGAQSPGTIAAGAGADPFAVSGTHAYGAAGPFTVTTTVHDAGGAAVALTVAASAVATAALPPPAVDFTYDPNSLITNRPVDLHAKVANEPAGAALTYEWDFGGEFARPTASIPVTAASPFSVQDGGPDVVHTFLPAVAPDLQHVVPGGPLKAEPVFTKRQTYTVRLRVTDAAGQTAVAAHDLTLAPGTGPIAGFTGPGKPVDIGHDITFTSTSIAPNPGDAIVQASWTMGDGRTVVQTPVSIPSQVCGANPGGQKAACASSGIPPLTYNYFDAFLAAQGVQSFAAFAPPDAPPPSADALDGEGAAIEQVKSSSLGPGGYIALGGLADDISNNTLLSAQLKPVTLTVTDREGRHATISDTGTEAHKTPGLLEDRAPHVVFHYVADGKVVDAGKALSTVISADTPQAFFTAGTDDRFDSGHIRFYELRVGAPTESCSGPANQQPSPGGSTTGGPGPIVVHHGGIIKGPDPKGHGLQTPPAQISAFRSGAGTTAVNVGATTIFGCDKVTSRPHIGVTPMSSSADPVVVTDPANLTFKFTQQDVNTPPPNGFSVLLTVYDDKGLSARRRIDGLKPVSATAKCQSLTVKLNDTQSLSGSCLNKGFGARVYWFDHDHPAQYNGLTLRPETPGDTIVLDNRNAPNPPTIYATHTSSQAIANASTGNNPQAANESDGARAQLLLDDQPVSTFRLGPDGVDLGAAPAQVGLLPVDQSATYRGLGIAPDMMLTLNDAMNSTLDFHVKMPTAFRPAHAPAGSVTETGAVHLAAATPASLGALTEASEATYKPRPARPAQAGGASTGPVTLTLDGGTAIGPMTVPDTLTLTDDGAGGFSGNTTLEVLPGASADVGISVHGQSLSITGAYNGAIALGGSGLSITHLGFGINNELVLTAQATVATDGVPVLEGTGQLDIALDPSDGQGPDVQFKGAAKVAGLLPLAQAYAEVRPDIGLFRFGGSVGYDFGPVSFEAGINGAFHFPEFYLEGSGHACLFACVGVDAVVSNLGVGVCGSLDLFVHTFRIGFSAPYGQLPTVYADSCDVSSLIPGQFKSSALPPTGSFEVFKNDLSGLVVRVRAVAPGIAPRVTLTAPPGDGRVFTTPAADGDFASTGASGGKNTALVDENPIDGTTTFVIAPPHPGKSWSAKGSWAVALSPGSVPIAAVDSREGLAPLKVSGSVTKPTKPSSAFIAAAAAKASGITLLMPHKVIAAERSRVRMLSFKLPNMSGATKTAFVEEGPQTSHILGYTTGASGALPFDPADSPDKTRKIYAFVIQDGRPRGRVEVTNFTAPPPAAAPMGTLTSVVRKGTTLDVTLGSQSGYAEGTLEVRTNTGIVDELHYGADTGLNAPGAAVAASRSQPRLHPRRRVTLHVRGIPKYASIMLRARGIVDGRRSHGFVTRRIAARSSRPRLHRVHRRRSPTRSTH